MHVIDKFPKAGQPKSDRDLTPDMSVTALARQLSPGAVISDLGVGLTDRFVNISHFHLQNMIKPLLLSVLCELLLNISFCRGGGLVLLKNNNSNSKTINLVGAVLLQAEKAPRLGESHLDRKTL